MKLIFVKNALLRAKLVKIQWHKKLDDIKEVSIQQIEWLLQGLEIESKKVHHPVEIDKENSYF